MSYFSTVTDFSAFSSIICVLMVIGGVFFSHSGEKKSPIRYLIPIGVAFLIYKNMRKLLLVIVPFVGKTFSMRTINRLLNHEFFEDSMRTLGYRVALDYIHEHPFLGCGVVNDRVLMNRAMSAWEEIAGSYPHNFFLELGMQFGVLLGSVVAVIMLGIIVRCFLRCRDTEERLLAFALICAGFVPLMVSGSYLTFSMFHTLFGFCTRPANAFMKDKPETDVPPVLSDTL